MTEGYDTSAEVGGVRDIDFPPEGEDPIHERPFRRADGPGASGHQTFDNLGDSFFVISFFGAFPDIPQELSFFSDNFQAF
jgi:hypothetical protein